MHALAKRAMEGEPTITTRIQAVADRQSIALVGLGQRIKQFDSLAQKMVTLRAEGSTVPEALDKINDIVRYRLVIPDHRYSAAVETVANRLQGQGQYLYSDWNAWASGRYKGINLTWQTEDRVKFEIQFHTERSYYACTATHDAYKQMKSPTRGQIDRRSDQAEIARAFSRVPDPDGVEGIHLPESIVGAKRREEREDHGSAGPDHRRWKKWPGRAGGQER